MRPFQPVRDWPLHLRQMEADDPIRQALIDRFKVAAVRYALQHGCTRFGLITAYWQVPLTGS